MKPKTVLNVLANAIVARNNCISSNNPEYEARWEYVIEQIEKNYLPHGSGVDSGCKVLLDSPHADGKNKIIINTAFHHMNDGGSYDGWTEHKIVIKPDLLFGYTLDITGKNRNDIKDYLTDLFTHALETECTLGDIVI